MPKPMPAVAAVTTATLPVSLVAWTSDAILSNLVLQLLLALWLLVCGHYTLWTAECKRQQSMLPQTVRVRSLD